MPSYIIPLVLVSLAPYAIYLALKRPLMFPLGLYIIMVPFDNLLVSTTTLTRLIGILTAGALLFHMILNRQILAPPKSWTAWAAFTLCASCTAFWTVDTSQTMLVLGQVLQLFIFFTILAMFPASREDVRGVGAIIVVSGVLVSLVGLFQYAQGVHNGENRLSIEWNGASLDQNHFAASLLLPIALAVGCLLETRNVRLRLSAGVSAALMMGALFFAGSRGGLIALAAMLLYIAWKTRYRLSVLALMAVFALASLFQPAMWARFTDKGDGSGSGRLFIWNVGKLALKEHWLLGAGIGAFPTVYNHELLAVYQPVFQGWGRPAHNALLSAAVEVGIVGAALLTYAWWRSWTDAKGNVVIEASLVGLAIAALFLDVIVFKYLWLAFGMAALVRNAADPHFIRGNRRIPQQQTARREVMKPSLSWRARRFAFSRPGRRAKKTSVI